MDETSAKQIQQRFEELPDDVQRAIQSSDLEKKLEEIGTKRKLHIDQVGILGDETRLVMLGFSDPSEFAATLAQQLKIGRVDAEAIAEDVSQDVFVPIRKSMQQFAEERVFKGVLTEEAKSQPPPASPAEKSVIMPSKAAAMAAQPVAPKTPESQKTARPQTQTTAPDGVPQKAAIPTSADVMLTQPTISTPKPPAPPQSAPPKPAPYKTDPYREPPE